MRSFNSTDPQSHKGKTDSWLTPLWLIQALGNDFDLDPCGFEYHKTAREVWQLPKCGILNQWSGKVWLNPPYSEAKIWLDKMTVHRNGSVIIFSRTGPLGKYMKDCDHLFFLRNRVRFLHEDLTPAKDNPGADTMILSWGHQDFSNLNGVQIK